MSALGHTRTSTSAFVRATVMSALCQKQTFRPLFDMIDGVA
jgi:hypothetical protein